MSDWIDVARVDDFAPGDWQTVDIDDVLVAVFNLDGKYFALEDICTHDGGTLTGGDIEGNEIVCPRHGARFDITTGEALTEPAYEDLPMFAVRVLDGMVQVRDDRWD
jgi:3-phenylpropionate/trans-cinnamate dioxygenase ferredoxin subunit